MMYMLIVHPILFWKFSYKSGFFVRGRSRIKHIDNIEIGKNVCFGEDTRINIYNKISEKLLFIGDNSYFVNRNTILVGGKITIGKNVLVASDVCILSESHVIDPESLVPYKNQGLIFRNVNIGDGTWIGEKAVIMPGVSLGRNCIVGAGSIVTKSFGDECIIAGNPAKVIKKYNHECKRWERIKRNYDE